MQIMTIKDVDLKGKRVLVREDLNVPRDKKTRELNDDTRIRAAVPTIKYLVEQGAKVIVMSHLGRPKGEEMCIRDRKCRQFFCVGVKKSCIG